MNEVTEIRSGLIVLAHPERRSFNGLLADRSATTCRQEGMTVSIADLYGEKFDPVEGPGHYSERIYPRRFIAMSEQRNSSDKGLFPSGIQEQLTRLHDADLVIFQFPLWWYGPPAMLKGWFDRVMMCGEIYTAEKRYDRGAFRGKHAVVSVTTGSPRNVFGPGRDGEIDVYLWPIHFTLHYLGFTVWPHYVSYGIRGDMPHPVESDDYQKLLARTDILSEHLVKIIKNNNNGLAPLAFNGWDDWDRNGELRPTAPDKFPFVRCN